MPVPPSGLFWYSYFKRNAACVRPLLLIYSQSKVNSKSLTFIIDVTPGQCIKVRSVGWYLLWKMWVLDIVIKIITQKSQSICNRAYIFLLPCTNTYCDWEICYKIFEWVTMHFPSKKKEQNIVSRWRQSPAYAANKHFII